MTLIEAARQALPGIAWEQVSSNGVEYVYGEGSKDSYGVFDLADIAKITAELKADRDALDADLDETPRAVLTDELTALRERMRWRDVAKELPGRNDEDEWGGVLVAWPYNEVSMRIERGALHPALGWVCYDEGKPRKIKPTHWQPMPAAPEVPQ